MATYANLSPADKAIVDNTVNLIRGAAGSMAAAWTRIKAIADDTNAVGLVTSLDAGQVIPNTSGLAGADDLTKEDVVAVWQIVNGIRAANDNAANRAAMSKAAGVNAILGSG